jgi:ubiquinone/menaquinone biosynthesis C-methylase UbiE
MSSLYGEIYKDGTYLKNNPTWDMEDANYKTTHILKLLAKYNINAKSILDIGCGSGRILVELKNKLPLDTNFYGVDISPQAIELAKSINEANINIELRDITTNKLSDKYDLTLVIDVIEHVEDYFKIIRELREVSNYTLFHIPLDLCIWSLFREKMLIESKQRVGHIHNFTEDFMKSILTDHGFEIISAIYTEPLNKVKNFKQSIVEFLRKLLFTINPRFCSKTIGGMSLMVLVKNPK